MRAIILAAGRGSRMKELTDQHPKCLVKIRGKTLLDRQLAALRGAGIEEIGVVTGYRRELLSRPDLIEFHNRRWAETQMVSSLACANKWLEAEECLVTYSDIFYTSEAVQTLMSSEAQLAITYDPNWLELWKKRFGDPLLDAETFRLSSDGIVLEIGGRPNSIEEIHGQYMGLLKLTPNAWEELMRIMAKLSKNDADTMHMTGVLQKIVHSGCIPIHALPYRGEWGEVDSAVDLALY